MVDRSSIRTLFSFTEAFYDFIFTAGVTYAAYISFQQMDTLQASANQTLVVDRYLLPSRLVSPSSKSYFFSKPTRIYTVPHFVDETIRVAMGTKDNNLLELKAQLRLHAVDPILAKRKYGSELKGKYVKTLEDFLKKEGEKVVVGADGELAEGERKEMEARLKKFMYYQKKDLNVLHEVEVKEVKEIKIERRVVPEMVVNRE